MVLRPELLGDPLAERASVRIFLSLLWRRLLLRHLGRARAILCRLGRGEDRVGDIDREPGGLRGVGRIRGFVVTVEAVTVEAVAIAILAAENLGLELLEMCGLLRHGEQQNEKGE